MRLAHKSMRKFLSDSFIISSIAFLIIISFASITISSEGAANNCIQCHSKPDYRITNKKIYKYYQDWELSIHGMEGVTCDKCHGGNPDSTDEKEAHGKYTQQLLDPVRYEQISVTCGKCHQKNAENYKNSNHYKILTGKDRSWHLAPTCVTCHGSINTTIPQHDDIIDICSSCHNADTGNHPEVPEFAGYLIERLAFINYYTRYLISKDVLKDKPQLSKTLNKEFSELSQIWHTLDLDSVAEKTRHIRTMLMKERKEQDDK